MSYLPCSRYYVLHKCSSIYSEYSSKVIYPSPTAVVTGARSKTTFVGDWWERGLLRRRRRGRETSAVSDFERGQVLTGKPRENSARTVRSGAIPPLPSYRWASVILCAYANVWVFIYIWVSVGGFYTAGKTTPTTIGKSDSPGPALRASRVY